MDNLDLEADIVVDPVSAQWSRLFRVPLARRDDQKPHCAFLDLARLGQFDPPLEMPEFVDTSYMEAARREPTPGMTLRPSASELARMVGSLPDEVYVNIRDGKPLAKPGKRDVVMIQTIGKLLRVFDSTAPTVPYRILFASVVAAPTEGAPPTTQLSER